MSNENQINKALPDFLSRIPTRKTDLDLPELCSQIKQLTRENEALKAERDAYEAKVSRIKNLFSELCDYHVANFYVPSYCFIGRTGVHQNWYELHSILQDDSKTLQLFLRVLDSGKKMNLVPSANAGGE